MIDIAALKREAAAGKGESSTVVTRRWLAQVAAELEAGRMASADLERRIRRDGETFGLKDARL